MPEPSATGADAPDADAARIPHFTDKEAARQAGRKGAARRKELAELRALDPDSYIREKFKSERAGLTELLLDAAYGRKSFAGDITHTCECGETYEVEVPILAPEKRMAAIVKALEYAVGRPTARKDAAEEDQEEAAQGLTIE